jgi:hypothetical protein
VFTKKKKKKNGVRSGAPARKSLSPPKGESDA